jgi:hypothetical protein
VKLYLFNGSNKILEYVFVFLIESITYMLPKCFTHICSLVNATIHYFEDGYILGVFIYNMHNIYIVLLCQNIITNKCRYALTISNMLENWTSFWQYL